MFRNWTTKQRNQVNKCLEYFAQEEPENNIREKFKTFITAAYLKMVKENGK